MGSDLNCSDNYYVSQNNNNNVAASFYDRSQVQSSGGGASSEWLRQSGQELEKSSEQKQRSFASSQMHLHNQQQWNFSHNPYLLYNENPYGIILSTNSVSSSQQVPALIASSSSTSTENNNTQPNVYQQSSSHPTAKRVFYQGLHNFLRTFWENYSFMFSSHWFSLNQIF